jgi:hypothetical protein
MEAAIDFFDLGLICTRDTAGPGGDCAADWPVNLVMDHRDQQAHRFEVGAMALGEV